MKYTKGEFVTIPNKSALRGLSPNLQVLFFWLCDHADDNMQSFPSRQTLADECGMGIRTLDRSMQELVKLGYIVKSARSNGKEQVTNLYEVVIFDTGAKLTRGVASNLHGGVASKKTLPSVKKNTRNSTHLTQPIKTSTNVLVEAEASKTYGKPEINELFEYWEQTTGVGITTKRQANRNACNSLYKKLGVEKLRQVIDGVALAHGDRYAPRISDFVSLQYKLNDLLVWGKQRSTGSQGVVKL